MAGFDAPSRAPQSVMAKLLDFGFSNIDLWRSEEMNLVQLIIPSESAHDTVAALGEVGLLQFKDLNASKSAFQRTYAHQVKRCDEMARRLRYFKEQVDKAGMRVAVRLLQDRKIELDELETRLEELEKELIEVNGNSDTLQRTFAELTELQIVLEKAGAFFNKAKIDVRPEQFDSFSENPDAPLLESQADKVSRVGFVAGTIPSEKVMSFERLLFRATRGNMYLREASVGKVKDPATGDTMDKHVFVIFFAGDRSRYKVMKICEAFSANRYPFPDDPTRQRQMLTEVSGRIRELSTTLEAGERHRETLLTSIAANLEEWTLLVRKEKAVYHTLNRLNVDVTSKVLIGEAWVPTAFKTQVQDVLRDTAQTSATQLSAVMQTMVTNEMPPTHYQTNKFTLAFQTIVDAYGVARYREVNPAVLTLMTFPFLFSVMFGDLGHALLMVAFAAFLIIRERVMSKQDLGDMVGMMFGGRYVILLMGLFSIWMGLIYNEFFSMPMRIFGGTRFECFMKDGSPILDDLGAIIRGIDPRDCQSMYHGVLQMPKNMPPYVFGIDPVWHNRKTELPYLNSVKMKMSILLGVTHMDFGIMNSLYNNLHYKDTLSTICEFVPQIIFLNFIFGYLAMLIVIKWCTGQITDLYHVMIYMFLSPGSAVEDELISGQGSWQVFLLLIAFVAVPWMLVPKPLILKKRHEALMAAKGHSAVQMTGAGTYGDLNDEEVADGHGQRPAALAVAESHGGGGGHGHGDHFEFGEVMVHQMIHTIEFVLGCVSNTASYLRLWALSLAHSQLSGVFFDRVLMPAIASGNVIACIIGFFIWACATMGVLMVMESLSAFLHALRLHWVEYMNKFYKGDGYAFTPFTFAGLKDQEDIIKA